MREIKEGARESLEKVKDYYRKIKNVRQRASRNRALMPTHPIYQQQLARDTGRVAVAVAVAFSVITGLSGLVLYSNIEQESNRRAAEECLRLGCQEEVIATAKRRGVEPNPILVAAVPSFMDIKTRLDEDNGIKDILPAVSAGTASVLANTYALGAGLTIFMRHRRKLVALSNPTQQPPHPQK